MTTNVNGFTRNNVGEPTNWSPTEVQIFDDLIKTLVIDTIAQNQDGNVEGQKDITYGHRHASLYDGYGEKMITAHNALKIMYIGEQATTSNQILMRLGNDIATALQISCDVELMAFDTFNDTISLGRSIADPRPVAVGVQGNLTAENLIVNNCTNIVGGRGGFADEGEILVNAYFDGTSYRRINSGLATRFYSSGGAQRFFTAGGGGATTVIDWGEPMLTIGDGYIGLSNNVRLRTFGEIEFNSISYGYEQPESVSEGEVWATLGHPTLPDNVLMIGA